MSRTIEAAKNRNLNKIALAGGVAANNGLRKAMTEAAKQNGLALSLPKAVYCTDNAAMVASGAYFRDKPDKYDLNAYQGRMGEQLHSVGATSPGRMGDSL